MAIYTWSWCILWGSHKPLDTCNLELFVESETFDVWFCSWPNVLEPCSDVIADFGKSQSF